MILKLWNDFSKRVNSTKIPTTTPVELEVVLKEDTSIDNPSFLIEGVDFSYTYAQWEGSYYFIDQIIAVTNDLMQITCSMDAMATNKTAIGNTNAYIAYSSTGYDTMLIDNRMATKVTKTVESVTANMPILYNQGVYILSVANANGTASNFACQYVLSAAELSGIAPSLWSDDVIDNVARYFTGNPIDTIISCLWMPLRYSDVIASSIIGTAPLKFGSTPALVGYTPHAIAVSNPVITGGGAIGIPWAYDDFRRNSPYTTMSLFIPCYGLIEVNPSDLIDEANLNYEYKIDVSSGDVTFIIKKATNNIILNTINYNIGVSCPIAQTSTNAGGIISATGGAVASLGGTALGIATQNPVATLGGISGLAASVSNAALSANQRTTSVRGSIQGRSSIAMGDDIILYVYSMNTEDPDNVSYIARHGRPVMHYDTISSHSGYIQCDGASIDINVLAPEREQINAMLNSGFYYE